jgi:FKBP-type peptidyl-prolyl cis-trans isomerase
MIKTENFSGENNNNNRRKTVLMTGMSALLSSFAGRTTNSQAAELKGQVKDCENCSNSNTSLKEGDKEFLTTNSGLRYIDLREGDLAKVPKKGDVVVVDWVGYTAGYQAKKIESTRETDAPFTFRVGSGEAIPAFDEAVLNMGKGGIKRIEIAGELEEKLGYSRNPGERYNGVGPKPTTFGGLRALDFVLDNKTLKDFNRTLLFDVKLVAIRSST